MANEVMIPSADQLPAHLQALISANPNLMQITADATQGISGGAPPTITAVQGMFKAKVDGVEEVIQINVPNMGLMNAPKIAAVILRAKGPLDRTFYVGAYNAGQESQGPDCSSEDGIKPKADSPNPQCTSCAGCPQNIWGSTKMQDGTPGKGKACGEKKRLVIYANKGIYRFNVPPASLGDFSAYAKQLAAHGRALPMVITAISFDPVAPTKLVFAYQGDLNADMAAKILPMATGAEALAILEEFGGNAPKQTAAPVAQQTAAAGPSEAEKAETAKREAAFLAAAEKKTAAAKKAAEKKAADDKKAASDSLGMDDLGMDLGMGLEEAAPAEPVTQVFTGGAPSDDELAGLCGL
jgi:hypothetical protein